MYGKNAGHRQYPACDGALQLVLTETRSHREGRFPVGENHANPTTRTALMEHHKGHEEHEAIRDLLGATHILDRGLLTV